MTKEQKQEFTLRITQANKTQMLVILYEMLLTYVKDAKKAHESADRDSFKRCLKYARGCVKELMLSLNYDTELAGNLLQLYIYVNKEMTGAEVRNRVESLDHVIVVVSGLHEAYQKAAAEDHSKAVMSNAQTIYAGLTYGKNDLTENLADQGGSRGFFV